MLNHFFKFCIIFLTVTILVPFTTFSEQELDTEETTESLGSTSEESEFTGASPFAAMGEAENLAMGISQKDIRKILDKKLAEDPTDGHKLCVIAELMRRVGHTQTEEYYEKAINAKPKEPSYHLWYGRYLWYRGLNFEAEKQYFTALRKVRERRQAGFALKDDPFLEQWIERAIINNYQDYGVPLTPNKGYPYKNANGDKKAGLFYLANVNIGRQPVDYNLLDNHTMAFTTLKGFFNQGAYEGNKQPIADSSEAGICRSPFRFNTPHRFRFYTPSPIMPAIDLHFGFNASDESMFFQRFDPDSFVDTRTTTFGAGITRSYSLGNVFDIKIEAGYNLLRRMGMIEFKPDSFENVHKYDARLDISRFLSSDKLILSFFSVFLDIPEYDMTSPEMEKRARFINGAMFDYAFYRAIPLPTFEYGKFRFKRTNTRGFHIFGGYMIDEEVWNPEHRIDHFALLGTHLKGIADGWVDVSFFPMLFWGDTEIAGKDTVNAPNFPERFSQQLRFNLLGRYRLIDEERTPWLPKEWNNFLHPASLELAVPLSWDIATQNTDETYENFGLGVELWSKMISKGMHGATFLFTAAYQFQRYYQLDKNLHNFHFDIRLGWGRI